MSKQSWSISDAERIYLVLTVMFSGLAASEFIENTLPSGRWGWIKILASGLGDNGYAKLLAIVAIIWFLVFVGSVISRKNRLERSEK